MKFNLQQIVSLCKRRGFIFAWSDIYWWFSNSYTYWPYWVELKNNIKSLWWKTFIQKPKDMVWIDWGILLHPATWKASGHVDSFSDALIDCKSCKTRHRADHLIEEQTWIDSEWFTPEQMTEIISKHKVKCPKCWDVKLTEARNFNLMFSVELSKTWEDSRTYLRPETAQAIFLEYRNILTSHKVKLPFGIWQIGKAFRNEITPGNFTFRLLEFEQMEIEYFITPPPGYEENKEAYMKHWITANDWKEDDKHHILSIFWIWLDRMKSWCDLIWLSPENVKEKEHAPEKLSHYSKKTVDLVYNFPFWFNELYGLAYRTDFDLASHEKHSWEKLKFRDALTNKEHLAHVIEPTFWLDRTVLAILCEAYDEIEEWFWKRVVMRFKPNIAPIKVAVLPLSKKLSESAVQIYNMLSDKFTCEFDDTWSIWRRYARQDEVWTPFCVTIDFDSIEWPLKDTVTLRFRDTQDQIRLRAEDLLNFINKGLDEC